MENYKFALCFLFAMIFGLSIGIGIGLGLRFGLFLALNVTSIDKTISWYYVNGFGKLQIYYLDPGSLDHCLDNWAWNKVWIYWNGHH